jgi:endonuclease/exonuclease/phosphatase family metal-dependent hydrolase
VPFLRAWLRRRSPLVLVPVAFLTLACGSPGGPDLSGSASVAAEQAKNPPAPSTQPREKQGEKTQQTSIDPKALRFGIANPPKKADGALRLAFYNVENLFDANDDPKISGSVDDKTMTTPAVRLQAIADAIRRLDADVLALSEIESKEALEEFRATYLGGLGYDHLASIDAGDGRGIEQAVLSRIEITAAKNWPSEAIADMDAKRTGDGWEKSSKGELPKRWARSPLMVDLKTKDGQQLVLFVVHHKSGRDFNAQRELEALQTIAFAAERIGANKDINLAILGDFNAVPSRKSVKVYAEAGFVNAYEFRVDPKARREAYVTHVTDRAIDYIFLSPGLAKDAVQRSFFVLGTPLPPEDASEDILVPGYASDHLPVALDVVIR